jgi:hypothetical protein
MGLSKQRGRATTPACFYMEAAGLSGRQCLAWLRITVKPGGYKTMHVGSQRSAGIFTKTCVCSTGWMLPDTQLSVDDCVQLLVGSGDLGCMLAGRCAYLLTRFVFAIAMFIA